MSHTFELENHGGALLRILNAEVTCACTALVYDREIAPGETGRIKASLKTEGDGGRSVRIGINVQTNDPDQPALQLVLKGDVEKVVDITPSILRFEGPAGKRLTRKVILRPASKYPFTILSVDAKKGKHISYSLTEKQADKQPAYHLTINMEPLEEGRYFDKIIIRTDSPYKPEISIGLFAKIG